MDIRLSVVRELPETDTMKAALLCKILAALSKKIRKQANTDSSKMAEVIGVSEAQLRFVTNTAAGMGFIKCGSVVIVIS